MSCTTGASIVLCLWETSEKWDSSLCLQYYCNEMLVVEFLVFSVLKIKHVTKIQQKSSYT